MIIAGFVNFGLQEHPPHAPVPVTAPPVPASQNNVTENYFGDPPGYPPLHTNSYTTSNMNNYINNNMNSNTNNNMDHMGNVVGYAATAGPSSEGAHPPCMCSTTSPMSTQELAVVINDGRACR